MKVEVQQVTERGRSISARERALRPSYRGRLRIQEARNHALGRTVVMAELLSLVDGPDSILVPALHDACVLSLANGRMRVRGFELVEGAQYAQTWDVRVS